MADEAGIEGTADTVQGALEMDGPGAKLRRAREAKGMSLADVAIATRVAQRQLEAIEREDYAALPGIPYAIGFARAYARAVDLDEVAVASDVRAAVNQSTLGANRYEMFEPADPARVPSRTLAWTAAAIALVVAIGFGVWRAQLLTAPTTQQVSEQQQTAVPASNAAPAGAPPAVAPTTGPVILTAVDDVWLRIYDETGERLKDGLMKKGERYALPDGAKDPMILTGRPQALTVTVGGKTVAPLGPPDRTIADVPISAAALLARQAPPAAATTVAGQAGTSPATAPSPAAAGTTPPASNP
ncbi:helix-turn-helix domain-containing protein [Sphingobium aromaticiconvertens]|uniref:helix-turn-helix domain-containing protein n=1 Tax=Sphingobium aromaticiconvertens TaxID=365341 RepID=UPI003019ABB2